MLTDRAVKTAKVDPGKSSKYINGGNGLYLRVLASGARSWVYRMKGADGKTRWLDLGPYPSVSLLQANTEANILKQKRRQGIDPIEELEAKKAEEAAAKAKLAARLTVDQLFEKWMAIELVQRKDEGQEVKRAFEKDVLPIIGKMFATEVTRADVAAVLDNVVQRGARRMANRILTDLRQMFGFAYVRGVVEHDPTHRTRKSDVGGKEAERDRVLSDAELRQLVQLLPQAKLSKPTEHAVWIALATACRIGELLRARWEDVNLDTCEWHIPAENSKNAKAHTVYVSSFARSHFEALKLINHNSVWLYPDRAGNSHVCVKTVTKQIGDRQRKPEQGRMSHRATTTAALRLPGGKWTPHDLRRTAATIMASLGVRPDVIEHCLNHTETNKVKRIYQRHDYKEEQKAAWQMLGERLEVLGMAVGARA